MTLAEQLVPSRTLAQRRQALKRANEIRFHRAELKRQMRAGQLRPVDVIASYDERVDTMRVWDLLIAQPKIGRVKVNRLLTHHRIAPSKTIGGLSERQRNELLRALA